MFWLVLLFSVSLYAQDGLQLEQDILEPDWMEESKALDNINFDDANKERQRSYLREHLKEQIDTKFQLDYQEFVLEDLYKSIENSGTQNVVVNAGAKIFHLRKKKFYTTAKNFVAVAHKKADPANYFYLLNKFGLAIYKVPQRSVTNIDPVVKLSEPPVQYETYNQVFNKAEKFEKIPRYYTQSLQFGLLASETSYLQDLYDDEEMGPALGASLLYDIVFKTEMPLKFGLQAIAHYQTISGGESNYTHFGFRYGPSVKTSPFQLWSAPWRAHFSGGMGLASTSSDAKLSGINHTLTYIRAALEKIDKTDNTSWGVALDWANHSITQTEVALPVDSNSRSQISLNFFIIRDWSRDF